MNLKFLKYSYTLLTVFFFSITTSLNAQNQKLEINDKNKLVVINKILSFYDWNESDSDDKKRNICFSTINLSDYVQKNFPRNLGDFKVFLESDNKFTKAFNCEIFRFRELRIRNNWAYVTLLIDFPDGCQSGTINKLVKWKGKWFLKSSEPFAASC